MAKQTPVIEELDDEVIEEEETAQVLRPNDLAKELGVDGKRVRAFLRDTFPRPTDSKNTNWELTQEMADAVKARFTPSDDQEDEVDEDDE